jgi:hypothetical protein
MRYLVVALLLLSWTGTASAQGFEYKLGFKALADQIPSVVGEPLENEHWGANGDSLQKTSKGLMAWRKADNWTAFTDGATTWLNGPNGLQSRPNTERFEWEADYQAAKAQNELKRVIEESIGWQLERIEKITVEPDRVYIEVLDSNWVKDILQSHQYRMITGLADYFAETSMRPQITIKSAANLGAGNYLQSVTPGSLIDPIANTQAGQSEWIAKSKFTVTGQLY